MLSDFQNPSEAMGALRAPLRLRQTGKPTPAGFTFVEVMVTAVIVAILAAVSVPMYTSYIRTQKKGAAKALSQTVAITAGSWMRRNGGTVPTVTDINTAMPVPLPSQYALRINTVDATHHYLVVTEQSNPSDPQADSSQF